MCQKCDSSVSAEKFPRRNFLRLAGAAAFGLAFADRALAASAEGAAPKPGVISPDAALARLIKGNERYVNGTMKVHDFPSERAALALAQHPFAGILGCADSRVAPEYAFDTGRGDLFVCRVAGNFVDEYSIASFEYGVVVLGLPFLLVLGHSQCGAVGAAVKAVKDGAEFPGHIPALVKAIRPAVKTAQKESGDLLANAIKQNVLRNVKALKSASPILDKAVKEGRLRVEGGVYELSTGRVEMLA